MPTHLNGRGGDETGAAKFVPRVLTEEQKYKRVNVARD